MHAPTKHFPDVVPGVGSIKTGGGAFSSGAILFGGADGKIQQDATQLFWDDTNNRLGLGTAAPIDSFHHHRATLPRIRMTTDITGQTVTDGTLLQADDADFFILTYETGSIRFYTGGGGPTEQWQIDNTGNLLDVGGNFIQLSEIADPAAPADNKLRLYCKDNGAGKEQLVARFATGAIQVIATEP